RPVARDPPSGSSDARRTSASNRLTSMIPFSRARSAHEGGVRNPHTSKVVVSAMPADHRCTRAGGAISQRRLIVKPLEQVLDGPYETGGLEAVDDAMVERHSQVHHRPDGDG